MSNNVRIWAKADKKSEAAWLGFLLTLTGCQVWKGNLSSNPSVFQARTIKYQYIDILLFETIDWLVCGKIADTNPTGAVFVCGNEEIYPPMSAYAWRRCSELQIDRPDTLRELIQNLYPLLMYEDNEQDAILHLTDMYVLERNKLARAIYSVTELFCSRKIDYRKYDNRAILIAAVQFIEKWSRKYVETLARNSRLAYVEVFALTYLQNLVNEGCIKAGMDKVFVDEMIFSNTNYLMKFQRKDDAVLSLKLKLAHNSDRPLDEPMQLLDMIIENSSPEYINQAFCEMAEMYRENPGLQERAIQLLERIDYNDTENYQGLYKLGLLYEEKGEIDFSWYQRAEQEYRQVMRLLGPVKRRYRTPQEFEYYYKAKYRKIKMQYHLNKLDGQSCQSELKSLIEACTEDWKGLFLNKFFAGDAYDDILSYTNISLLMEEKMSHVKRWAKNLYRKIGGI